MVARRVFRKPTNQVVRDQWDFKVFKSFPMFFDIIVPLRSASVHQAGSLNASLGREVCARRKEDRVGVAVSVRKVAVAPSADFPDAATKVVSR
jgi:hypothetical protein